MATLVLNAVGTALGGPIGGALGSLVGQSIDRQLFGPGMRKGPRLGDLSVQTSTYGSPIPRIYGTMRVAGSVIWATDIEEDETIEGGGKGSPEYVAYKYSANFAVALSSRPIRAVKRIWADGKLIRGAVGDFKVKTKFRVLTGSEDQAIDPMIASVETIARTPAYRGIALAVFEELQLGEFGNRIPVLTFEVEADDGDVALGALMADASDDLIAAEADQGIAGYAAHGASIGDSLSVLIDIYAVMLAERDGVLCSPPAGPPRQIGADELGSGINETAATERIRSPESSMPGSLTMTYYEPERDYQTGQMRASSGHGGAREERIELPAVLSGTDAKSLAEAALARRWRSGDRIRVQLPPAWMTVRPGDALQLPVSGKAWIARSVTIEGLAVAVEAEAAPSEANPLPADPGRPVTEPDQPIGRSELALFELPPPGDEPGPAPIVHAAASSSGIWKRLPVELAVGQDGLAAIALIRRAVLGRAEAALPARCPLIADDLSSVTIRLVNLDQPLFNADDDALMAGANLAVLGDELIQFGKAQQVSAGLYRLSRILRGRRGTEWAASQHAAGEPFCMINQADLQAIQLQPSAVGLLLSATAHGIGDMAPLPVAQRSVGGETLRPPSPCHLTLWRDGSLLRAAWVRRSHRGWTWADGIGDATDSFAEAYRLSLTGPGGTIELDTVARSASWELTELPALSGQSIGLSVVTVGPLAVSRAVTASLIL